MATLQAAFYSATGESKGKIDLPESLFSGAGSRRVLQEAVVALQANQRRGTSSTKTRGLVSGGGHKPWKQKGTGNARAGSIRSPLWRKGGIIFGPHPRSYRIDLDRTKRWVALLTALMEKAKASELVVIEALNVQEPKTREAEQILKRAGASGRMLVVVDRKDETVSRAFGNIADVSLTGSAELNAWQVMVSKRVFLTQAALGALEKRRPVG